MKFYHVEVEPLHIYIGDEDTVQIFLVKDTVQN